MPKIRISPAASINPTTSGVVLRSDLGTFELKGEDVKVFVSKIVPLLDGSRAPEALADALPDFSRSSVLSFLELLRQKGLTEEVEDAAPAAQAASRRWKPQERFFHALELDETDPQEQLRQARILLVGAEPWGVAAALELAAAGIGEIRVLDHRPVSEDDLLANRSWGPAALGQPRAEALAQSLAATAPWTTVSHGALPEEGASLDGEPREGEPFDLLLTALTADDAYHLEKAARFGQATTTRSLGAWLDGFEAWVGPGVLPGETACWNCFRLRRLAHADAPEPAHELDARLLEAPSSPRARTFLAPMAPFAGHLLALEALKLVTGFAPARILGRVYVQNLVTGDAGYHGVVRMPWCPVCGGAASRKAAAREEAASGEESSEEPVIDLRLAGDVENLRQILDGWVDEKTGVIRSLTGSSAAAAGAAGAALPLTGTAQVARYTEGRLTSLPGGDIGSGKGLTALDAHIGAVGEAIERYSAARYRKEGLRLAAPASLNGDGLDPRRLVLYDDAQYRQEGFPYARFDPHQPIHWVEGKWFGTGEPVWVPAVATYFNFQTCHHEYFCQVSSNGLAAGSSVEDAALRAVFELVERDAFLLSWYARRPGRRILLDGSLEPALAEILRQQEERGVTCELYLFDLGSGIPTVVCLGLGDGEHTPAVAIALAAHANPLTAVRKAILEQAHVNPYLSRVMQTAKIPETADEVRDLEDHALYYAPKRRLPAFDFLRNGPEPPLPLAELGEGIPATVEACAESLRAGGFRIAVVDVTSPDVVQSPFRVVRAVGADVQPIHFGEHLRRLGNPRLKKLLGGEAPNGDPHPVA